MSGVEWVETAEEVVVTEDRLPPERISPTVIHVLEAETTPIQKLLNSVGQGETPQEGFYCEECVSLFQDQNDPESISGPSFVLDFPTSLGVPQRALLTLPYGLMIGRSSIPNAGIGVVNHGPAVSPGMHFGPYEGEVTTRENASDFSWEIYKDKDQYEYIDAARESHSNWMRYINCARSRDESNLLAVQYKGSILFHCCRTISPGDELMVWPSSKLLSHCSDVWSQRWILKLNAEDGGLSVTPQMFLCSHCQLAFTTEAFLQRHVENSHTQPQAGEAADREDAPAADWDQPAASSAATSVDSDESKTCGDCGKVFKQLPHLRRHKLCVHSNKRPYCCPHCRRSFSQASGLIRHQLVHRKHTVIKERHQYKPPSGESRVVTTSGPSKSEEPEKPTAGEGSRDAETAPSNCANCGKSFANEASLKKHRMFVHENLRPYVCTVCQKSFGQCHDLSRHLWSHQNQNKKRGTVIQEPETSVALAFSCSGCPRTFSSVDALQQHVTEAHSEASVAEGQDVNPLIVVEVVQDVPSQRPQRPGARSKILAITKLLSPKRRASSPAGSGQSPPPPPPEADAGGNPTKTKWFCCSRCKQTYGDAADLKAHQCTSKPHKCGQCGATFGKLGFLKRHQITAHTKAKSYSCERCRKVFTTCGNLKQHQKINTCMKYHCTSELFPCSYCQFSFSVKSYLLKHIKRHHPVEYLALCDSDGLVPPLLDEEEEEEEEEEEGGDKEHICQECGKIFSSTKAFKSHKCPPQVKVLYLCTDCGKGFSNHYGLKQHQRIHTGEKPYSCPHCTKSFSYVGQLNVHLRTHTGEKPYLCTHCGESFRQSGDLKRHERKHTGVRPYSCPECSKSFSRPQSLKAHQMLHRGQRMFKCTQCGKSFSRNYHLRRHHQKMHT